MATVALESVTATVIDLYVYWKLGFRIKLEALLLSSSSSVVRDGRLRLGYVALRLTAIFNDSVAWQHLELTVGILERGPVSLDVVFVEDSTTRQHLIGSTAAVLSTEERMGLTGGLELIDFVDLKVGFLETSSML